MELTGSHTFEADQQTVWTLLMDPEAIAKAIPGVKELIPIEGEEMTWRAAAKVGFAALSGHYAGIIKMSEVEAPNQYRLTVNGEGQQSVISGTALIKLTYHPEKNETLVSWDAEANISGKLASLGQRLIGAGANVMSKQFFHELAKQLPTQ
ncbi:MAG: carbon monoxide dehydrogenase subunit G [Chloroflexi bacterium]|nr:carbon monoxide dehydrogenase subunit G [Chloroflexota bacterium]